MLLKKQTVWLLTMLSLVVVLSVYYITSEPKMTDLTSGEEKQDGTKTNDADVSEQAGTITSGITSDEKFDLLRMEMNDTRSQRKEDLEMTLASTELPRDQRDEAYSEFKKLNAVADKERILESLIQTLGYDDALVRVNDEQIIITVKSKEKTAKAANDIIQLVKGDIGSGQYVTVDFQIEK